MKKRERKKRKRKADRWTAAKASMRVGHHTKANIWDRAAELTLMRSSGLPRSKEEPLDPGVNFFVMALEALGLQTQFSCEGHPDEFYITFWAPYKTALWISSAGFFCVQLNGENCWGLRLTSSSHKNAKSHVDCLRWAANAWMDHLGLKGKLPKEIENV